MIEMEYWIAIRGYEGLYEVSNLGRVRSLDRGSFVMQDRYEQARWTRRRGRLLKIHLDGKGYPMVRLCRAGIPKTIMVHRLVAQAFIPNLESKPAINHIDSNPFNNRVHNLEWCTIAENNAHTRAVGRYVPACTYKKYAA
jgi:hypothetical protein